jgi:hypothetical protein
MVSYALAVEKGAVSYGTKLAIKDAKAALDVAIPFIVDDGRALEDIRDGRCWLSTNIYS